MTRVEFTNARGDIAQQLAAHLVAQGHDVTTQRMDHGFHVVRAGESTVAEQVESKVVLKIGDESSPVVQAAFTWLDSRCKRVVTAPHQRHVWFYVLCAYAVFWGLIRAPGLADAMADDVIVGGFAWVAWVTTVVSAVLFIVAYLRAGKSAHGSERTALLARKSRWFVAGVAFALATLVLGVLLSYGPFLLMCAVPLAGCLAAWQALRQRRKFDLVGRFASGDSSSQ